MVIRFFKTYSEAGEQLVHMIKSSLPDYILSKFHIDCTVEVCDSKGLKTSSFQVLQAALNNEIVIIDGSIEELHQYPLGVNYECVTPAVSSLDNILIVSRTQLPLNLIACRTNVAALGEADVLNIENNKGGYTKSYTNKQILNWLYQELDSMHSNRRLVRDESLKIDMSLPIQELMQREMVVMDENLEAIAKERAKKSADGKPLKKIFISYRTAYYPGDGLEGKYKGKYSVKDLSSIIQEYHRDKGDLEEWDTPFYYPKGVLSNEFMPEVRRWAFVSIPDRKIRDCKEFWIFNTNYEAPKEGKPLGEVGYWDSWWCVGEFMTIVRMKYSGSLSDDFKVMVFSPDAPKQKQIKELTFDEIPYMTDEQNRELSRYFANGDFLEAGMESMATMRMKREWSKLHRYLHFLLMKKVVWPRLSPKMDFKNYPFRYFEESVFSHVYDESFVRNRILECSKCKVRGKTMDDVLTDGNFVWKFLNVNNYYSGKGLHSLLDNEEIIQKTDDDILQCKQSDGSYVIECRHGHKVQVKVSKDHFYIFWTPRNGEPSGPGGCVIEKVDLYEVV